MFRKIGLWLVIILVAAAAGTGYLYFNANTAQAQATEEPAVQTTVARTGSIIISASGSGAIIPAAQVELGFNSSGRLSELFVSVGDQVKAGDKIAALESTESASSLALKVSSAELSLLKAQQNLDELTSPTDTSLELAQVRVELAQTELDLLKARDELESLTTARQVMISTRCEDDTIAGYQDEYDNAVLRYNRSPSDTALQAVNTALANLNYCAGVWTEEEIAVKDAEIALTQTEVANLEARLIELQIEITGYETPNIDAAELTFAEAELKNSELNLEAARESMATQYLIAPMDGTILEITAQVGETIGSSPIITLADLSLPMLEIYVDETDLNQIGIGYEIEVIFDALPDQTFSGKVISIDPSLAQEGNVMAVRGIAQLDAGSFAKPQTLPIGMSASVEIIGSKAENVILVPVEAVRELSPGSYGVFVMQNGEPKLRMVEVGLLDYTSAEIKSGLQVGDIVTTGIVETGQ